MVEEKECTKCHQKKALKEFGDRTMRGRVYKATRCNVCRAEQRRVKRQDGSWPHSIASKAQLARERKHQGEFRQNPAFRALRILRDGYKSDKARGRQNDLDEPFVAGLIAAGCSYCGASVTESKITLDRIDNAVGHTKVNVVAACANCNLTRGNMPYTAWLPIAATMRQVREAGLLRGWKRSRHHC